MSDLSAFLAGNVTIRENRKVAVSDRFKDTDGNPIEWEIRDLSAGEDEELRKACTKQVPLGGNKNKMTQKFDSNAYLLKLASKAVVFPNLADSDLQKSYGVMGEEQLLRTMLYKDEFDKLVDALVNTDEPDLGDMVDDAKN